MNIPLDIGMAVGPVVGYVHQYIIINKSKSVGTFSIDICGILLFANILRLNFYVFQKYATSLFFQSVIMIIAQIFLVRICTKYRNKINKFSSQSASLSNFQHEANENLQNFWRWNLFSTYLLFIVFFTFLTFSITITFNQLEIKSYGVMIGLVALLSQSILILPQILKNCENKSTKGLSYILVTLNLGGDIFKLVYFIVQKQAFQFILCGVIQVCLDSFVIIQIFWYRKNEKQIEQNKQDVHLGDKENNGYDIKAQTQKDLDEIQMQNVPQVSQQVQYNLQPQPAFNNEQQNMEQNLTQLKRQKIHNPQSFKIKQNDSQQIQLNVNQQVPHNIMQLKRTNSKNKQLSYHKNVGQIKKVISQQSNPITSQTQFFKASYSHPIKSVQNLQIQC